MAYRGEDSGDALEAPTADGLLKVMLGPNRIDLAVGSKTLHITDRIATVVEHKKKKQERRASVKITGNLVIARGFPRESIGIWIERTGSAGPRSAAEGRRGETIERTGSAGPRSAAEGRRGETIERTEHEAPAMQRIFGVEPASLLERDGLGALGRLDAVAQQLRNHLAELAGSIRRAIEIGSGHALDKVLLADHGDRMVFYARRLFRDRARVAVEVHRDGRIIVPEGKTTREVKVTSRFGVRVSGDHVWFADPHGIDLAKVSLPWIGVEDREEVARRIGQLVHRD